MCAGMAYGVEAKHQDIFIAIALGRILERLLWLQPASLFHVSKCLTTRAFRAIEKYDTIWL